ncbi:conserved hypothetical protein, membrane or secreted [Candidatus Magnetomorum sp. HK-1]|nr:conserved hypothetical protein, membrane or secreted [Candidatus Magnetomorum sp. HK-1]
MNLRKKLISSIFLLFIFVFFLSACSGVNIKPTQIWSISLTFIADQHINNGIRLPVDVIAVKSSDAVLEVGPEDWFGDSKREKLLKDEIFKLAIGDGEKRQIKIKLNSEIQRLLIFADYTDQVERKGQQIVIDPDKWQLNYIIHLKDKSMELEE